MCWKNNNLEISVFESWVVMLRTGKIALNTFKNIHLQSNICESPKEGTGRWWGSCRARILTRVAGVLGPVSGTTHGKLPGCRPRFLPQCLWPFTKGNGRLAVPSNSQEQPLLSSLWSWPRSGSRCQAKGCRRAKQHSLWEVIFGPPGEESLSFSQTSVLWLSRRKRS